MDTKKYRYCGSLEMRDAIQVFDAPAKLIATPFFITTCTASCSSKSLVAFGHIQVDFYSMGTGAS
jgi:hypothetical protein